MKNSLWRLFVPFTIPQYHFHFAYFFVAKYIFSLTVYLTKTLILYLTSHALSVPQCRTPRVHWTLLGQCGRGTKSHWKCRMAAFILPCWNAPTLSSTAYLHSTVGQPFNYPSLLVNKSLQVSLAVSVKSLCFTELERHIWNRKTCWLMGWWMFIWLTDNRDKADRWSVATIFRDCLQSLNIAASVYWSRKLSFFQAKTRLHLARATQWTEIHVYWVATPVSLFQGYFSLRYLSKWTVQQRNNLEFTQLALLSSVWQIYFRFLYWMCIVVR